MKPQYQHELMTSFFLWFDHELLQKGEAYSNKTGTLYAKADSRLPDNYISLQSNYKQWVNDSSVTGETNPIIPTSFGGSGRSNNIIFDFENGRLIETGGSLSVGDTLTGTFAVKDFNIYLTNESEEDLIVENKFTLNSRYGTPTISGIEPYDQIIPAIFINSEFMRNEGFAFGGEDKTTNTIKAVVLAENDYQLDGVLSIFADSARKSFSKIPFSGHPVTEYGDIKNESYLYKSLSNAYSASNPYYIEDVIVSKFSERAQSKVPGDIKVGFIDFDVSTLRYPRS
tara:strand:- start:62 stop:913 length:852 start_codon:yes stop_codon:yes gene_type:complete